MRIITTITGAQITVYSDPAEEMAIDRYNKFQKYLLIESGIGHTIESADAHYTRQITFVNVGDMESLVKEIENNRHCLASILSEINYTGLAFACMVDKIDENTYSDLSEDGLSVTLKNLSDCKITQAVMQTEIGNLKKK